MDAIKRYEGIVIGFGDFVAQAENIEHGRITEKTRLKPGGVVQDKKPRQVSVAGVSGLKINRVKSTDAAGSCVLNRNEQVSWREEKGLTRPLS